MKHMKIADEQKVHISITSDYIWGKGWSRDEADKFENIVYPKLIEAGYEIKYSKDSSSCDYLVLPKRCEYKGRFSSGNKLNLYMHPMEFTGSASPDDVEKIVNILKDCPECIYDVKVVV